MGSGGCAVGLPVLTVLHPLGACGHAGPGHIAGIPKSRPLLPWRPQGEEEGGPLQYHPAASKVLSSSPELWPFLQLPMPPPGHPATGASMRPRGVWRGAGGNWPCLRLAAEQSCHGENYEAN